MRRTTSLVLWQNKQQKKGYDVFMVTPDKDYAQLVSPHIFMYRPARMGNGIEIWGEKEIREKFEVNHPRQIIDYLAMMGDAVDNIPGIHGVGDKTAKKFVKTYGSLEGLYKNIETLKGKIKEKVAESKEIAFLSKQLVTIIQDCPINLESYDFFVKNPNFEKIIPIFNTLEFKRSLKTLEQIFAFDASKMATTTINSPQKAPSTTPNLFNFIEEKNIQHKTSAPTTNNHFQWVKTPLSRFLLLKNLLKQQLVICSFWQDIAIEDNEIKSDFFVFSWDDYHYLMEIPSSQDGRRIVLQGLKPFFENKNIEKVGFNFKEQIKTLYKFGVHFKGMTWDLLLMDYLCNPDEARDDIDYLLNKWFSLALEKKCIKNYCVNLNAQFKQLFIYIKQKLSEEHLDKLYKEIEFPLMGVLARMEMEGICVNINQLKQLSNEISNEIHWLEQSIYKLAKTTFNIGSPKQLGSILFEHLKLTNKTKKTKTGQYSTSEEVLNKIKQEHPVVTKVLEWRSLVKLQNTYIDSLSKFIDHDGRIHTTYKQNITATGRLSSVKPNLQNIPIRTKKGRAIRTAFVAKDEDHILVSADYSQIELRLIAAMSQCDDMIFAFQKGEDIHQSTAAKVFEFPLDSVTKEQRAKAKNINFGILYGQGSKALSEQTNMSFKEAKQLIESYYKKYPQLETYRNNQINFARDHGYVSTLLGRKRYLDQIHSQNPILRSSAERNALNTTIQGSAADIIKKAMIVIENKIIHLQLNTKILLQVHDELVFEVPKTELSKVQTLISSIMENAVNLSVPLKVDMGIGLHWLDAH